MIKMINFRNQVQADLFKHEISGQISDGMWENARPFNHWKVWCEAEVAVDPENVGVNFWAQKNNYGFDNHELLEIIGERMINICMLSIKGYPDHVIRDFHEYNKREINDNAYWTKKREAFIDAFGSYDAYERVLKEGRWTMKQVRSELKDMKAIIKIFLRS